MKCLLSIILMLCITNLYGQKKRSLDNLTDRKYFYDKLTGILKGVNITSPDWSSSLPNGPDIDTLTLRINDLPKGIIDEKQGFEEFGAHIAYQFWKKLLKDFPEFNFFSIVHTDENKKRTTMTYHYMGKDTIEYYSHKEQEVVYLVFIKGSR